MVVIHTSNNIVSCCVAADLRSSLVIGLSSDQAGGPGLYEGRSSSWWARLV